MPTCDEAGHEGLQTIATMMGLQAPAAHLARIVARLKPRPQESLREPAMAARMTPARHGDGRERHRELRHSCEAMARFDQVVRKLNLQQAK